MVARDISLQGGPHEHQIAGIATQLKEVLTPAFKTYAKQVREKGGRGVFSESVVYGSYDILTEDAFSISSAHSTHHLAFCEDATYIFLYWPEAAARLINTRLFSFPRPLVSLP